MHLIYVDDSGDADITTYSALAIHESAWHIVLGKWLAWRRRALTRPHDIGASYELHATDWLGPRPDGLPDVADDDQPLILGRNRSARGQRHGVYRAGLESIGSYDGIALLTVASETVRSHRGRYSRIATASAAAAQAHASIELARRTLDATVSVATGAAAIATGAPAESRDVAHEASKLANRATETANETLELVTATATATSAALAAVEAEPAPSGSVTPPAATTPKEGVDRHELYGRLVDWLDAWLAEQDERGVIFLDGGDPGARYRRQHRDRLPIGSRRVLEDPQPMTSSHSQLVQMADWCAHSAYRYLRADQGKEAPQNRELYLSKLSKLQVLGPAQHAPGVRWEA